MALLRRTAVGLAVLITVGLLGSMCAQTEKAPAGNKSASKSQVVNEQAKTRGAGEQDPNIKKTTQRRTALPQQPLRQPARAANVVLVPMSAVFTWTTARPGSHVFTWTATTWVR